MAQGAQICPVKYDTGSNKFFIADNDSIPAGDIVTAVTNPLLTRATKPHREVGLFSRPLPT